MKYTVITNNDGELNTKTINSRKSIRKVCQEEYDLLVKSFEDEASLGFELTDEWEEEDKGSVQMGATIDYCMGRDYIYDVSVKVTAA